MGAPIVKTANADMKAMLFLQNHGEPQHFIDDGNHVTVSVPSASSPGEYYTACYKPANEDEDEYSFCTCAARKQRKDCWHVALARYIARGPRSWQKRSLEELTFPTILS